MSNDALTYDDIRSLKIDGDLGRFIKQHMAVSRAECARRRSLVLRYPDLAAKLTEPPLRFTTPEHWNGYIPPATWNQALNPTPGRAVLLALVEEAEKRQSQPRQLEEAA